jgi:hypothetical protein
MGSGMDRGRLLTSAATAACSLPVVTWALIPRERFHEHAFAMGAAEPEGDAPLTPSLSPPPRKGEGARRAGEG